MKLWGTPIGVPRVPHWGTFWGTSIICRTARDRPLKSLRGTWAALKTTHTHFLKDNFLKRIIKAYFSAKFLAEMVNKPFLNFDTFVYLFLSSIGRIIGF